LITFWSGAGYSNNQDEERKVFQCL